MWLKAYTYYNKNWQKFFYHLFISCVGEKALPSFKKNMLWRSMWLIMCEKKEAYTIIFELYNKTIMSHLTNI